LFNTLAFDQSTPGSISTAPALAARRSRARFPCLPGPALNEFQWEDLRDRGLAPYRQCWLRQMSKGGEHLFRRKSCSFAAARLRLLPVRAVLPGGDCRCFPSSSRHNFAMAPRFLRQPKSMRSVQYRAIPHQPSRSDSGAQLGTPCRFPAIYRCPIFEIISQRISFRDDRCVP
jgi:hypothetical protein